MQLALKMRDSQTADLTKKAVLTAIAIHESGDESKLKEYAALSIRICNENPQDDDPRFSIDDYMDAVVHARRSVNLHKLLTLDVDDFAKAMGWLAQDKRETYEEREHNQEPLDIDIY